MDLWSLPLVKYRHIIKKLVSPLKNDIADFGNIAVYVVLKSGKFACLSSSTTNTTKYSYKGNSLLIYDLIRDNRVIYPDDQTEANELLSHINVPFVDTGLHRGYCFTKYCSDCCILVVYDSKIKQCSRSLYKDTITQFTDFIVDFLNHTLNFYIEFLPELAYTRFILDADYRKNILIANLEPSKPVKLNHHERSILYWSAHGKSAEEISIILGFTKNTINSYRKKIIIKMRATTITQAVYIASTQHIIV